jgi:hypothetical protein
MMLITQIASSAPASTVSKMLIFRSAFPMIIFVLTRGVLVLPTPHISLQNYELFFKWQRKIESFVRKPLNVRDGETTHRRQALIAFRTTLHPVQGQAPTLESHIRGVEA